MAWRRVATATVAEPLKIVGDDIALACLFNATSGTNTAPPSILWQVLQSPLEFAIATFNNR